MAEQFSKGSRVEVKSDEEGFRGAWYVATIMEIPKPEFCVVVYDTLMEEENEGNKLSETVPVSNLRPSPPLDKNEIIKVNDVVDANHRDGWWTGVVVEVFEGNKFLVYFDDPPDELVVERVDLRLHLDWINGKWERPQNKAKSMMEKLFCKGTPVEVSFGEETYNVWHVGTVLQVTRNNDFIVNYQCVGSADKPDFRKEAFDTRSIRPTPPQLEDQEFVLLDKVDAYFDFCWWRGVIHRILENRQYVVLVISIKEEILFDHSNLRPRLDWINGKWTSTSRNTKVLAIENEPFQSSTKKKSPKEQGVAKYFGSTGNRTRVDILVDKIQGVSSETQAPIKKDEKKRNKDREKQNIEDSRGRKTTPNKNKGRPGRSLHEEDIGDGSKVGESYGGDDCLMLKAINKGGNENILSPTSSNVKDKMRRSEKKTKPRKCNYPLSTSPPKEYSKTSKALGIVCLNPTMITNTSVSEDEANERVEMLPNETQTDRYGETNNVDGVFQNQGLITNIPWAQNHANGTAPRKRVRKPKGSQPGGHEKRRKTVDTATQTHDDGNQIDGPFNDMIDDQPLLMWIRGNQSPTTTDYSGALLIQDQSENSIEGEDKGTTSSAIVIKDIVHSTPLQISTPTATSGSFETDTRDLILPFVKSSPVWKSVESMEIYNKTSRKPHFSPLKKCKEEIREGLAIAYMVTFSSMVDKTLKLSFSDPLKVIKGVLETVVELGKHGFDVEAVQARLMSLLAIRQKKRELQAEYKEVKNEITKIEVEKGEVEQESTKITKAIRELEEKLYEIESRKEMKDDDISTLRLKQGVISQNVLTLKNEFDSVAASPLAM